MDSQVIDLRWAQRLYDAVEKVDIFAVKQIVNYRGEASPDIILPQYGISAFHLVVGILPISFSREVTEIFLAAGGNPNVRSCEGVTPVHVSSIWGRAENLKLLLLAGGDPMAVDDDGFSSLDYAKEHHHVECIDIIQKYGACGNPALGMLSMMEIGIEPSRSENLNDLSKVKSFHVQNKLVDATGCNLNVDSSLLNACQGEQESQCSFFFRQGNNNCGMQNIEIEENDLIYEADESEDFVEVVDEIYGAPKGGCRNITPRNPNETYSIIGRPRDYYFNYYQNIDDCLTEDESENCFNGDDENKGDNVVVRNLTYTLSSHDSPYYPWTNFYLGDGASTGKVSPPLSHHGCGNGGPALNASYCNFLPSPEPLTSSPQHRRGPMKHPTSQFEEISHVWRRKPLGLSCDASSISSNSCPNIHQKCFEEDFPNITHRRKMSRAKPKCSKVNITSKSESEEYFTVPEEVNEITDEEEGIVLEEKRLETPVFAGQVVPRKGPIYRSSSLSSLNSGCTEDIRRELQKVVSCGCSCPVGPITATTKRVYLRVIKKFKKANAHLMKCQPSSPQVKLHSKFSTELEETLTNSSRVSHGKYLELEQKMMLQFDGSGAFSQWREGNQKSSFNYLLLDPRTTRNLPSRWARHGCSEKSFFGSESCHFWREFLSSIFYVGKGKRSRPYSHLYEAVTAWRSNGSGTSKSKKKVNQVIDIWKENLGVVCLHLFQNVIPAEALTREAAMIDAIGLKNLTNEQRGKYYGLISNLGFSEKRYFGSFLLHRAFIIFLAEGERQIKPAHLD